MSFTFEIEAKKRYKEKQDKFFSKYPELKNDDYKGCVYFIGELSPVKNIETEGYKMLYFIKKLEEKGKDMGFYFQNNSLKKILEDYNYDEKNAYEAFRYVKIGHSTQIKRRLKELQTSNPRELILLGVIDNVSMEVEKEMHKYLETLIPGCRKEGEWFDFSLVKYHIRNWLYPYTKNSYKDMGFYDEDQDLLRLVYNEDTEYYRKFLKDGGIAKTLPKKELEWLDRNTQFIKGHTKANKTHLDFWGDLIRKNDCYYKIDSYANYDAYEKLSCVSLFKFVDIAEKMGIKRNISNLKFHIKKAYKYDSLEGLARSLGFQYNFFNKRILNGTSR